MSNKLDRREFLRQAGAIGAAAALGSALSPAFAEDATPAPKDEKLKIAWVGAGGQASGDIGQVSSEDIVALCDVDDASAAGTYKNFPNARKYKDFREMLDKESKNIEAVGVTIPDHNHAAAAVMAMQMGKHVYCQKPLTHLVSEAQVLLETSRRQKVVTQMGNQGHPSYARTVEFIESGIIGPVREVHVVTNRPIWPQGMTAAPAGTPAVPATLDWDLWLATAAARPFSPKYLPFVWRGWWDFGTGALGDMGCHLIDGPFWALKLGLPTAIEPDPANPAPNPFSPPTASIVHWEFPQRGDLPPVKMTWYDGGKRPPLDVLGKAEFMPPDFSGSLFVGDKGKILVSHGGGPVLLPVDQFKDVARPKEYLKRSPGHYREWINACKRARNTNNRTDGWAPEDLPATNFEYSVPLTQTVLLGNVALRTAQRVEWDAANLQVTNLPAANALIHYHYRDGWSI